MLRFSVVENGSDPIDLTGAYLVGTDSVPLRADIRFENGEIVCEKRTAGPAALALVWPVEGVGKLLLETARLPERDRPYHLHREMARGHLMRLTQKREDWGLLDDSLLPELAPNFTKARARFVESVKADDPLEVAGHADEALRLAIESAERLSVNYAEALLARRHQIGGFGRRTFGCGIDLSNTSDAYRNRLVDAFDFAYVPVRWRDIEPREQEVVWDHIDPWVDWLSKRRIPIRMGPLVSFHEDDLPDWTYIWENDFETARDLVFNHIRRVVSRYSSFVQSWEVISGIHCDNCFQFNFEQLMELTRLAGAVCKQISPRSQAIVRLRALWGEYYARNQRSIPPMLYADMAVQSSVAFDAFGLDLSFGLAADGYFVRDMFQISSMLDRLAGLGKPFHISAIAVPASHAGHRTAADGNSLTVARGGVWHGQWDESMQAEWTKQFVEIALSKPFVETVCWSSLSDRQDAAIPQSGLLGADLQPRPAYDVVRRIRKQISAQAKTSRSTSTRS